LIAGCGKSKVDGYVERYEFLKQLYALDVSREKSVSAFYNFLDTAQPSIMNLYLDSLDALTVPSKYQEGEALKSDLKINIVRDRNYLNEMRDQVNSLNNYQIIAGNSKEKVLKSYQEVYEQYYSKSNKATQNLILSELEFYRKLKAQELR
jgi:hypothetical protein